MSQLLKFKTGQRKAKLLKTSRLKKLKHKKYSEYSVTNLANIIPQVRKKKEEARAKERRQEKEKEKVMSHGEKELWESGDWRDHVKDLNASFSKVTPTMILVTMLTMMIC